MYGNYGDFSRIRGNRPTHYTGVLYQQGRVALDADANEQQSIDEHLRLTELQDVIGRFGAPAADPGFQITVANNAINIGAGRYYVKGQLCDNAQPLTYSNQPYLLDPSVTDAELLSELSSGAIGAIRVYLEVWDRMATALDDSSLREPALGLADTTTRRQTVWRVVAEAQAVAATPQLGAGTYIPPAISIKKPEDLLAAGNKLSATTPAVQHPKKKTRSANKPAANKSTPRSARVTRTHSRGSPVPRVASQKLAAAADAFITGEQPIPVRLPKGIFVQNPAPAQPTAPPDCCSDMYDSAATPPTPGTLMAQTAAGGDDCSCEPTPPAGYRGLENQLYRVEIHQGGDETTATFKWTRENGSVVSSVTGISGAVVQTTSLGPDANLGFASQNWVELSDDTYQFGQTPNQPGELVQVQMPNQANLSLTMTQPVSGIDPTMNARVRRWDQSGPTAGSNGISLSAGTWLNLENGIQIQFGTGNYSPGDHWLIPARTASGQIEWPPLDSNGAAAQSPYRTEIHRAPLACIHWDATTSTFNWEDCRRIFSPLSADAMHVTQINWTNDAQIPTDWFTSNGLIVTFDRPPTGPITGGNFIVTMEIPNSAFEEDNQNKLIGTAGRTLLILDGNLAVSSQDPRIWQWNPTSTFNQVLLKYLPILVRLAARQNLQIRVRVKLLGHDIFAELPNKQLYLDGQAFGTTVANTINLGFPSGAAARASDFDSWFYLAPPLAIQSITINPASLTVNGSVSNAGTISVTFNSNPPMGTQFNVWPTQSNNQQPPTPDPYVSIASPVTVSAANTNGAVVSILFSILGNTFVSLPINYNISASLTQTSGSGDVTPATFQLYGTPPPIQSIQ